MVLRYILRNWLHNAAKEKVREKMAEAARRQTEPSEQARQPEPEDCHIGVIFALRIESGGFEDRLDGMTTTTRGHGFVVRRGRLKDRRIAVVVCGAGRESAAAATEALIAGHRPEWVLSAGFAGGLDPKLARSDILMVDRLVDTSGQRLSVDLRVDPESLAAMPGVHVGQLLTADRIIRLPDEKRALGQEHDAAAVDMETFAVAEVCRDQHVRFLAVRVINDAVDDELPRDVENLLDQKSHAGRLGAAAGAIWRRPASAKDMWNLRESALAASERLGKFLVGMLEQL